MSNGRLIPGEPGTLVGNVATMTHNFRLTLRLNTHRQGDQAPKYEAFTTANRTEVKIGAAWEKVSNSDGRKFLTIALDDPSWDAPLNVTAFPDDNGDGFNIVWRRQRRIDPSTFNADEEARA